MAKFIQDSINDYVDSTIKNLQEKAEKECIKELIEEHKIDTICLIANPKYKDDILSLKSKGVKLYVIWSNYVDEEKIYQIMDPVVRANLMKELEET